MGPGRGLLGHGVAVTSGGSLRSLSVSFSICKVERVLQASYGQCLNSTSLERALGAMARL